MLATILRLLTLVALMLMPFGMGAASAMPAHHGPAAASAGHCDEPAGGQPAKESTDQAIDCAMVCSMLAIAEAVMAEPAGHPPLLIGWPLAERGAGLHPDTLTPPPKLS